MSVADWQAALAAPFRRSRAPWQILAIAFLPGVLAGIQIAGLLFFLNPELPFSPRSLIRGILVYGSLWGLASVALILPFTWGRPELARRLLPWTIVAVLTASAFADWYHASHLSFYMPPGINTRLIKAGVGLSITALFGFYTALLHSLHNRAYGPRSRWLMALLVLASVYVMVERREAFKPFHPPPPRQAQTESQPRPTLWTVALGGATLDAILPLAEEGRLPFFADLIEQGAYGRLTSYAPNRGPALWTSLATGKLPFRHGVLGERVYRLGFLGTGATVRLPPVGYRLTHWGFLHAPARPVDSRTSEVLTFWEALDRLGIPYGLIGWPLSAPLSENASFAFSDRFFDGVFDRSSARPREMAERGILFRPEPTDIDPLLRLGLERPVAPAVLGALGQDLWRESLAGFLVDQAPEVGAVFLYLPGLEKISRHYFGAYYAVHFEGKQDAELEAASAVLIQYYQHLDRFLQELVGRARDPKVVAVVSPYGFEAPRGWLTLPARIFAADGRSGRADESPDGALLISGPGIEPHTLLSAELVDVLPTLLYALGMPIARDLDGRVLTSAFSSGFLARQPLTFVPSYETLEKAPEVGVLEVSAVLGSES